jgi:hypothetical protein
MENTQIENTEDVVIEDINEETLLSLDETLELDQEQTEIAEGKCKKEGEDMEDEEESDEDEKDDEEECEDDEEEMTEAKKMTEAINASRKKQIYAIAKKLGITEDEVNKLVIKSIKVYGAAGSDWGWISLHHILEFIRDEATGNTQKKLISLAKSGDFKKLDKEASDGYDPEIDDLEYHYEAKKMTEAEVSSDEEFTSYAKGILKAAHGDNYDEAKAMAAIEGILKKADGDYGAAVGMITSGLGEEEMEDEKEVEMKEETEEVIEENTISIDTSDITRLVESETGLTEEFKEKATTIFEAAVKSKIKETEETLKESYAVALIEEVETIKNELVEKIDNYLTYAVESWVEDNKVAIEGGLRTQIAENFIQSLKTVFVENYIEVPESKQDLVAEMETSIAQLQTESAELENTVLALNEKVNSLTREKVISESTTDLADTQVEKLKSLLEDIECTSETSFRKKVATIKEFYLNGAAVEETETLVEENANESSYITTETVIENETIAEETVSPAMQKYLTALSRLNKANEATVAA